MLFRAVRYPEKLTGSFWEVFLCSYKEGKRNSLFLPLDVVCCDSWKCGGHVGPEGASLGEQTTLLSMAEQNGGKNLGA